MLTHRGVEQLAARWAHNPKVASSSLAPATNIKRGCPEIGTQEPKNPAR